MSLEPKLPGSRTVLQWVRSYQAAGYSALSLIPATHLSGNRTRRWCPEAEALMNQVIEIYADTQRPTKVQSIQETRALFADENARRTSAGATLLTIPSASSVNRRLDLADPFYVCAKRYGASAAARKFAMSSNGPDVVRPMERVEMDENKLDVMSLLTLTGIWEHLPPDRQKKFETGRRWMYLAIDCATKCVVSMRLADNPNSDDAIRALRQIFEDKTPLAQAAECESTWHHHGGIGTLVTNMGPTFVSDAFQATVASLGVTSDLSPDSPPAIRRVRGLMFGATRRALPVPSAPRTPPAGYSRCQNGGGDDCSRAARARSRAGPLRATRTASRSGVRLAVAR